MTASAAQDARAATNHPPTGGAEGVDGRTGWLVVAATMAATFVVFGVTYSFATFFSAMSEEFGAGKGATALMFGLTIFFLFVLSVVTGRIADRLGPRPVVLAGAASMGVGLLSTSFVHHLWLGYVTYGLGVGVAVACCYVPLVSEVSGWFQRRRATALGVAVSGIGLGTLVVPPLAARLIESWGWRSTYRFFAVVAVVALLAVAVVVRRAPAAVSTTGLPLRSLWGIASFRRLYISGLLMGLSLFVPFVFLVDYAKDRGIATDTAAFLVSLLGVGSVGGRLVLGALGARLGVVRLYQVSFATMALSYLLWLGAGDRYGMLVAFALVLGVSYGGYVALAPAVCAQLFGVVGLGAIIGALYTASGIGGLAGPFLAGRLIDVTDSYPAAIAAALVMAAISVVILLTIRLDEPTVAPAVVSADPGEADQPAAVEHDGVARHP